MRVCTGLAAASAVLCACAPDAAQSSRESATPAAATPTASPTSAATQNAHNAQNNQSSQNTRNTQNSPSSKSAATPAPAFTLRPEVPAQDRRAAAASLLFPGVSNFDDALHKLNAGVGGIFITSWADPALLTEPGRDIHALRQLVGRPFHVAIDFEGGRVQRFSEILGTYPSPQALAAGTPQQVEATAYDIGTRLHAHGIDVNFAPVLDVDGAGLEVVGDRSFSPDPQRAGEYGMAFARGLENAGVGAVFKHYPGHGRASGDTHTGTAITPHLAEMTGFDLVPWRTALAGEPRADVMVGHMVVPGLGDGTTPASLNPHAYGLLRNHDGFRNLAYTDDLTGMRAITDHYTPAQAVVAAIAAGADQALWSTAVDIDSVIDQVVAAVEEGRIHPQRFAAAVERVRADQGLHPNP
ncbi:glycoside hydrolase family 3 protein [Corynebacterium lizhenjunii]|uniref:beta-N-acetylhexosaminidase n=2 Tax=Corynebacterium lizhenjunii TaxID=2709394 RepID=A0A7T0KH97_9CORY|nr:glycoside hydrolase family 3 protein [Corynebacterium lizhenjunii]QPK80426.1 glycoside hydrolase family 3 protein [Corynebacterium lizhenjunii]